jgi:SAM-dependent methyltransferase
MLLDQDRIRAILKAEHSYYGGRDIPIRRDVRWVPFWENLIAPQLSPAMRVLDVGCGNGHFLLELSPGFHTGLGIDNDPEHIQLAEEAKRAEGTKNVEFLLLDFPREIAQLQPESFDMVVSFRGPVSDTSESIQAALRLLRPDGLLFCEEIGELHDREVKEIFGDGSHGKQILPRVAEVRELVEQNGFDVRLAADTFTKWIYPDIYAWLQYQYNLWTWLEVPLPEPDDPRISLFAERNTTTTGEIATTHHVVWVAGVKPQGASYNRKELR